MSGWLRSHLRALAEALDLLIGRPLRSLLCLSALAALYLLPALAAWLTLNLEAPRAHQAGRHELVLVLDRNANARTVTAIEQQLQRLPPATWRFISREQALADMQADPALATAIAGLSNNPLSDAFIVRPGSGDPEVLAAFAHEARNWPGVADAEVDTARALREARAWTLLADAALLLALALGAAVLAGAAVTIGWLTQRPPRQLELAVLLGATPSWLVRPLVWQGLVAGAGASLAALAGVLAAQHLLAPRVAALAGAYLPGVHLQAPPAQVLALLAATGTLLAGVLAWFAARRQLPTR